MRAAVEAGNPPFKTTLVGIVFGGNPVTDYANDFWLVSGEQGGEPLGYVTSPWFSPELETNIALAYVPLDMRHVGTKLTVKLPEPYGSDAPNGMVSAEVVEVPFRPSVNPNVREVVREQGRDFAD